MANTVYLRYSNDNWATNTGLTLHPIDFKIIPAVNRLQGSTLRDVRFSHKISSRTKSAQIIISANELYVSATYTFIIAFYNAAAWRYSLDNWSTYVDVDLAEAGELPVEFLEGNKNLPEIKLTLIQKYPD